MRQDEKGSQPMDSRFPGPSTTGPNDRLSAGDEAVLTQALGQAPAVVIPADFAVRVAQQAVARRPSRQKSWMGWGQRLALGSGVLLTVALFALAPHASPTLSSPYFDAELVVFTELAALLLFTPRLLRGD